MVVENQWTHFSSELEFSNNSPTSSGRGANVLNLSLFAMIVVYSFRSPVRVTPLDFFQIHTDLFKLTSREYLSVLFESATRTQILL